MSLANRLWGAPRIHGELLKLGIEVAQSTVPSTWRGVGEGGRRPGKPFCNNHASGIVLFVSVILRHERRELISLNVTAHPTAEWIARQITDASLGMKHQTA
jgi:hypothetical protein